MDTEFKKKSVASLRSGKYKQDKHYLRTQNGYCCLGVACDTHDASRWANPITAITGIPYHGNRFGLSKEIRELYNISEELCDELVVMNDGGKTFEEIANYIESYDSENERSE